MGLGVLGVALFGALVLVLPPRGPEQGAGIIPAVTPSATALGAGHAALPRGYGVALAADSPPADLDRVGPVWYAGPAASGPDEPGHPHVLVLDGPPGPSDSALARLVAAHPGHWWILGAPPGPPEQDTSPDLATYTRFFARVAARIRAADPSAGIMPAGIAGADARWAADFAARYATLTGAPLDVDAWNIHGFVLDPADPYDFTLLQRRIEQFRAWMAATGAGPKPLVLSEFGVLYGQGCCHQPLDTRDQAPNFERQALAWLETSGQVQSWAWFTLDSGDQQYNGDLLRRDRPGQLSPFGDLYARHSHTFAGP